MQPPDEAVDALVAEWVRKADLDFHTGVRLAPEDAFRDIVVFHAQQATNPLAVALRDNQESLESFIANTGVWR